MGSIIGSILRTLMGKSAIPIQEHHDGPTTTVHMIDGERVEVIEYPKMYYKNHPNKPNNDEPKHKWHFETSGNKITWAQRQEFRKRAAVRRAAAAEED